MRILKRAIVAVIVASAAIGMIAIHKSNSLAGGDGNATAVGPNSPPRISNTIDPAAQKDKRDNISTPDAAHGWGPFRTVDW